MNVVAHRIGAPKALIWVGAWLGVTLALSACGDLTAGGAGEVEIEIIADSVSGSVVASPIQGTLTIGVQIFAQNGPREVELTNGVQELQIALDGSSLGTVSRRVLPSGRYRGGRIVFRKVEADVQGGLLVEGQPFVGDVVVDLGPDNRLSFPWSTELEVTENATVHLVVEMRAPRWLRLLNRDQRRVSRESFEAHPPMVRISPVGSAGMVPPR
jgi:hypothetical protein